MNGNFCLHATRVPAILFRLFQEKADAFRLLRRKAMGFSNIVSLHSNPVAVRQGFLLQRKSRRREKYKEVSAIAGSGAKAQRRDQHA